MGKFESYHLSSFRCRRARIRSNVNPMGIIAANEFVECLAVRYVDVPTEDQYGRALTWQRTDRLADGRPVVHANSHDPIPLNVPGAGRILFASGPGRTAMSDEPEDEALLERIEALEASLRELQADLQSQRPSRFPAPPSPREILRFTDEYAIPTAIAFLEVQIRTLEMLRGVIRVTDPGRSTDRSARRRRVSSRVLGEVDALIEELQTDRFPAVRDGEDILDEARALREEIRSRIDDTQLTDDESVESESSDVDIDVEEELRSIRSELEDDDPSETDNDDDDDEDNDDQSSTGENR